MPDPSARQDLELRPAGPGDDAGIRRVVLDAFGAEDPSEAAAIVTIVDELDASGLLRGSIVAVDGDEVVGHVALSGAWLDARERLVDVWVLSPLGVLTTRQGQGIGTALLTAAVDHARASGAPLVFLEGSPHYYADRGFVRARDLGFLPPSRRVPVAAFQVVSLPSWDGSTGQLIYPDVWWRHDATGLRDPLLGELEKTGGSWDD